MTVGGPDFRSSNSCSRRSTLAQAVGYLVASAGPLELGLLHSATGSWSLPVAVLFALNGCLLAAGLLAGRPRVLPSHVTEGVAIRRARSGNA